MRESDAADMAGHSIETQRRHCGKRRGETRPRSISLDAAASAAVDRVFGPSEPEIGDGASPLTWGVYRLDGGVAKQVATFETRHEAGKVADKLERDDPGTPHWAEPLI